MPAPFRIYSASAGSGKTYQLTKEYLKLALGYPQPADPTGERSYNPSYFKSILAITFTNDAAGEMKERIVGALRRFAQGAEDKPDALLAEVAAELAQEEQFPPHLATPAEWQREVRRRAAATFKLVLYHYADFAVSTIDSFVQRIVTAFTRELGLPASFEVELDTDSVLRTAVAALLDKVNRDPQSKLLSQTLADYALGQAEQGRNWNKLPDELLDFGRNLFNESVHEAVAQLGQKTMADFRTLDQEIRQRLRDTEEAVQVQTDRALAALAGAGIEAEHLAGGANGIHGHFRSWERWLGAPDAKADFPTATARKVVDSGKWWSDKAKKAGLVPAVEAVQPELEAAFGELLDLRLTHLPNYLLLKALQPFLFHASLLSELNKLVEEISRERNVVLISEFNRRIAAIVLNEPVPFLYERLGEKYRHLLIDEFQDTSVLQWNNLLPLVENAVANGGLSLAVGDAKQAIYRWRGGELEQILRLYQRDTGALASRARDADMQRLLSERYYTLQSTLEPRSLAVNFRSEPAIIDFNNEFFTYVRERSVEGELVAGIFEDGFQQEVPEATPRSLLAGNADLGAGAPAGHVELLFTQKDAPARRYVPTTGQYLDEPLPGYPAEAVLDYNESTCYLALQLIEQALSDGHQLREVAVLCRTRWQSRLVAKFLKERGFPIISADSLALQFAEVVNLLVAIMRVLHQSSDTLARAEALLLVDKVVRRQPPTPGRARHIAAVANDKESGKPFFDELRSLGFDVEEHKTGNLGLYELTERLLGIFGLLGANAESDYLFRFLDLTLEFSLKHGNNLGSFLTYWDERKGALSINAPGGTDAITITTVHKAKGLAYGIVIVPFADWTLVPRTDTMLWGYLATAHKPLPDLPDVAVVRLNKSLAYTPLAEQDVEEREKTLLDGLNTLYVSFTRPRHRLYIISKAPAEPRKTTGELPLAATPEPAATQGPARDVADLLAGYLRHLGRWQDETTSFVLNPGTAQAPSAKPQKPKTNFALNNLASTPWSERLKLRRHATTVFDFDEQEHLGELNRKLHYALRRLLSAQDLGRSLRQLVAEGVINQKERPELETNLKALLADPRLAPYFADGLAVETEREILVGGHTHRAYKPDRIVFGEGPSRATQTVTMLDFKLPPPQDIHKIRLREYARLFRELGYADVRGVIYYFGSGEVVEV
ncbi:exodeoxyribonuclease V subunit beta [Hymenobacter sp. BT559]|uniref:UvrD-helicase domain-containing protein n=1 Tax=Hymenobacter sp. BT559 TaxID=2795729 RepID=UPI0018ECA9F1|nr:UvrD-helicase domain-containing protein [Hymenobacter sp. BT559]MBJ6142497.1 UvrD-helicase domain-containing protein [Hymenobacter sp. BT559]